MTTQLEEDVRQLLILTTQIDIRTASNEDAVKELKEMVRDRDVLRHRIDSLEKGVDDLEKTVQDLSKDIGKSDANKVLAQTNKDLLGVIKVVAEKGLAPLLAAVAAFLAARYGLQ